MHFFKEWRGHLKFIIIIIIITYHLYKDVYNYIPETKRYYSVYGIIIIIIIIIMEFLSSQL
jgi:hypothetical protein